MQIDVIDLVAGFVAERITERVDANPEDHAELFDADGLVENALEGMSPSLYEKVADAVHAHPAVQAALAAAQEAVNDYIADAREWSKGYMSYYGLSQADFV